MNDQSAEPCEIRDVGLARNGRSRFWCVTHRADATGTGGVPLAQCKGDHQPSTAGRSIEFDPSDYPGGVALWGSVAPVFDTTPLSERSGVHVHARKNATGKKDIDSTYDIVKFSYRRDLIEDGHATIDGGVAVAYYIARFVGNDVECLFCTYCGNPHADTDIYAVNPHRKHLCHACGKFFSAESRGVSNPLALLAKHRGADACQSPSLSVKTLDVAQGDYPGGIQIWASNPAIVWLADRPEESGIHVHAYGADGRRLEDDTFGSVAIDGIPLEIEEVAYLMAQRSMPSLLGKVTTVVCRNCKADIFDKGREAFEPRREHKCECGELTILEPRALFVSNPLIRKLHVLKGGK